MHLQKIAGDKRGSALTEFAIVAPVLALTLVGSFDAAHSRYMKASLQGVVQKAARDAALQTGGDANEQAIIDNKVRVQVLALANNANIQISRRFYRTFSSAAAAQAEPWTDTDLDGRCNNGEPFQDNNQNGTWDADGGDEGQGGAKDRTLYTVQVSYPRFFPLYKFIGGSSTTRISASTILQNQPFADQAAYGAPTVGNCP
ncbi:MAG: pilus assembly protein [Sphingomonas sp.]|nr:pilus assembly protein [Sphingomonas sp.]